MDILAIEIADNTVQSWLIAWMVAIVAFVALAISKRFISSRLSALVKRTESKWDDAFAELVAHTKSLFLFIIALFIGSLFLDLYGMQREIVFSIATVAVIVQGGLWLNGVIQFVLNGEASRRRQMDPASVTTVNAMGFVGRLVLWTVVLLLILQNLGVDITALVAGLGIGGVAVALAVQNILGDLFASLSIVLDKPFSVGDFLIIGDLLGSVEHVGLKTTRLRSLSGEQLIFSNADLLGSRIRNYGRMFERRVVFNLSVTYQTPREKLVRIPAILRSIIEQEEMVRFDRSHFQAYGDFSLKFETVYYVLGADYNLYMDIQQAIYLRIHEAFEQEGIEFAYPTQTILVAQAQADAAR